LNSATVRDILMLGGNYVLYCRNLAGGYLDRQDYKTVSGGNKRSTPGSGEDLAMDGTSGTGLNTTVYSPEILLSNRFF
jgi:hypothetical protein